MASAAGITKAPRKIKAKMTPNTVLAELAENSPVDSVFPLSAAGHGSDITNMNVGIRSESQTFKVHENLLCRASNRFDSALSDGFVESSGKLDLRSDFPVVFEVLYQWVYSGLIRDASFSLQSTAYKRFCNCFGFLTLGHLTSQLVDELYADASSEHLQRYLVHHAAYHMGKPMVPWPDQGNWKTITDQHSKFKAATGAKVIDTRLSGEFKHPSALKDFEGFKVRLEDVKEIISTGSQETSRFLTS